MCTWTCCRSCVQRYLLSKNDDASCMKCNSMIPRSKLLSMTSKHFMNGPYKAHREDVLDQRERAMMRGDMPYVTQELQRRENMKLWEQLMREREALRRKLRDVYGQIHDLGRQMLPPLSEDRRQFVHRCSAPGCRGFLSTMWKCNVCAHYICPDCNTDKGTTRDAPHECNEADRQTMQLLKSDSRSCPGCAQFILKLSGCDQMWCTNCHTAFSWRTGRKINDMLHNPHFYAWQQSQRYGPVGRVLGDIPCGGMPSVHELCRFVAHCDRSKSPLLGLHRLIIHTDGVERIRYRTDNVAADNRDIRIRFILNEIDGNKFKSMLQQREKATAKRLEIGLILTMIFDTSSDLLRQCVTEGCKDIPNYVTQLESLIQYANDALADISKQYGCVVPQLSTSRYTTFSHKF